jgi:branched-chain amino acid transport system ATP-binding protein
VFIHEEDITGLKPYQIVKKGVARTFQTTSLFDQLRVIDNMLIAYKWRTRLGFWNTLFHTPGWKADHDQAVQSALGNAAVSRAGRQKRSHFIPTLVPGGAKAAGDRHRPGQQTQTALLDEPTGGLIQEETDRITQFIKSVREQGTTVCIIEHKMQMIMGWRTASSY